MDNLRIMHSNGTPIAIKKGCPAALKSYRIKDGICYYAQIAPKQYILFQNRTIGPFSIWLSDYIFHKPIILTSNVQSSGAEFHQILKGSVMFSYNKGKTWYIETAGDYNVLMNAEMHTRVAFTEPPVQTFDIHVDEKYFRDLVLAYPELNALAKALDTKTTGALFSNKAQSSLILRYKLTQVITLFGKSIGETKADKEQLHQEIFDLLEECVATMSLSPSKRSTPYKFHQTDLDNIVQVKEYITDNYIHP